ncbi:aldehyde dehydrogenase family protein [Alkalihalobacterium chitinilyticum]|uniref:Aldehyde dehydrogenase family protein n=1 Tax=Alkalihalobacterium chitinilyticum TaxID=2980103 RepID=A0ABT5VE83_9BACI|nr:aldehyde dehydrogenase family protein [Alkalihalobacterium chitinilyticum]MDE5413770.1 aldehyde dehydrogenase family protein [Alkalihalobacterium chitinilyticum]
MKVRVAQRKMFLAGKWVTRDQTITVTNPENNEAIATVPAATKEDMLEAVQAAKKGAVVSAKLPVFKRIEIIQRAADFIEEQQEDFAVTIALEGSKTIREARKEVARCIQTLRISAEEGRRLEGKTIPFDQSNGNENRLGYYSLFPIGIIGAITPFNDPLNLVAHKIGPAVASGNAIIVKPATVTPLSALKLAEAFSQAGLPDGILSVITGRGAEVGDTLVTHPDVRMISFTGGLETGTEIAKKAGLKKLSMELGSNSPVIVLNDANLNQAVDSTVSGAFWAAGQNCLGVQRIYVEKDVYEEFTAQFIEQTKAYRKGSKLFDSTDMGPLINEREAVRVESLIKEAVKQGATLACGGNREGAYLEPTVLTNVPPNATIAKEEIFGPVVLLFAVDSLQEAIERSNDVNYGLQAGIFTNHIQAAFEAIQSLDVGGVMVNDSSDFRIDSMPFGGVKGSGLGREGVKYAIQEMTEPKVVCFNL